MTIITDRMLKFNRMIKKSIVPKHAFFAVVIFSRISSLYQFFHNIAFITSNLNKKDCHQDNLSLACLQFCKHNCLNILLVNKQINRNDCKKFAFYIIF